MINPLNPAFEAKPIGYIPSKKIIQVYQDIFGIDVRPFFSDVEKVEIYECLKTGYRFFYPFHISGDERLYAALQQYDWYYMPWKWEHQKVCEQIEANVPRGGKILEIGCAYGSFLEQMSQKGFQCVGLEINTKAVCSYTGIQIYNQSVEAHSVEYPNTYDVVCSFQVMEHIAQVGSALKASVECLKRGGRLFISVPNNDSFLQFDPYNPLNLPPHHMGLWYISSLKEIAQDFGLQLKHIWKEPLQTYHQNYFKHTLDTYIYHTYGQPLRHHLGIMGRIIFRFFKPFLPKYLRWKYPYMENFTIIGEYIKV